VKTKRKEEKGNKERKEDKTRSKDYLNQSK